jgi:primary-amine oxidase
MGESMLNLMTEDEVRRAKVTLLSAGLATDRTRFAYVGLVDPPRLAFRDADEAARCKRRLRVLLLDVSSGEGMDVLVSLDPDIVVSSSPIDPVEDGQMPILRSEGSDLVEGILRGDDRWVEAIERRGADVRQVRVAPLSAGVYGIPGERGRRMLRCLAFRQDAPTDHAWAHPIDGLVAYVDLVKRAVTEVIDLGTAPVPEEPGNFDDAERFGPPRTTLKPIAITQPDGVSFDLDGNLLQWENWSVRVGFDAREGLVLHQIGFRDRGRLRPVAHRASIAEMVVPYADPSPIHSWQNYFDTGEYLIGRSVNSLEMGCDCLGEITYLDVVIADDWCEPRVVRNAVCIHEEDYGILWKHTDEWAGSSEVRRQRRLVVSYFTTIGNYDYGFYWYFYLDGTMECEVKATGVVFTTAYPAGGSAYSSQLAPGLGAPYHQHLFCARLEMTVDGWSNSVEEVDTVRLPVGPDNPRGNAFAVSRTLLDTEERSGRVADNGRGRAWHIVNVTSNNSLGDPVAYVLVPQGNPTLLAAEGSSIYQRAVFATKDLWVTQYHPDERYPAGDFVNQHSGGAGIPSFTAKGRSIANEEIVVWHTFGLTHIPRPEDWPIMPVEYVGFKLRPFGFFDRNPTLDVPPATAGHCKC